MVLQCNSAQILRVQTDNAPSLSPSLRVWVEERQKELSARNAATNAHAGALSQLSELRELPAGWLDGTGDAPSRGACDAVGEVLKTHLSGVSVSPEVYPTPDGGIQLEWLIRNRHSITVRVSSSGTMGEVGIVDAEDFKTETKTLSWAALAGQINLIVN